MAGGFTWGEIVSTSGVVVMAMWYLGVTATKIVSNVRKKAKAEAQGEMTLELLGEKIDVAMKGQATADAGLAKHLLDDVAFQSRITEAMESMAKSADKMAASISVLQRQARSQRTSVTRIAKTA